MMTILRCWNCGEAVERSSQEFCNDCSCRLSEEAERDDEIAPGHVWETLPDGTKTLRRLNS